MNRTYIVYDKYVMHKLEMVHFHLFLSLASSAIRPSCWGVEFIRISRKFFSDLRDGGVCFLFALFQV